MKILVTGANGFIGNNLVKKLLAEKHYVRVFLRTKSKLADDKLTDSVSGSFENDNDLARATHNIDVVYHLAAIRDKWGTPWRDYYQVNVEYTKNLLQACKKNKVKQFIYCSSISVITPPFNKKFYAKSKILAEKLVHIFCVKNHIHYTIIRPVITYGPGDNGMILKLVSMISNNKYLSVGNGNNLVHLCYIEDLIQGFSLVLNNKKAFDHAYCLCGPQPITINTLVKLIQEDLGKKNYIFHIPLWFARATAFLLENAYKISSKHTEPIISQAKINTMAISRKFDYKAAEHDFGYKPVYDYKKGIINTIKWYKGQYGR